LPSDAPSMWIKRRRNYCPAGGEKDSAAHSTHFQPPLRLITDDSYRSLQQLLHWIRLDRHHFTESNGKCLKLHSQSCSEHYCWVPLFFKCRSAPGYSCFASA